MDSSITRDGISILPSKTKLCLSNPHYFINEDLRLRICSVLSGIIDSEHLVNLRFGIWLPLLLIILHIYNDFTRGTDSEVMSFLNEVRSTYYGFIVHPISGNPEQAILCHIFYSADHASRICLLRLDDDGQSSCSGRMAAWVKFFFLELLEPTGARIWLKHEKALIAIDLSAYEPFDMFSRLWFPDHGSWETGTGIGKEVKRHAEFWSHDSSISLKSVPVKTYDLTAYKFKLGEMGL